jgi:hypothetical protein
VGLISKKKSVGPSTAAIEAGSWQGQQWEYRAIALERVAGPSVESVFNGRGSEGFEFVAAVKHGRGSDGYAIFKRPKLFAEPETSEAEELSGSTSSDPAV